MKCLIRVLISLFVGLSAFYLNSCDEENMIDGPTPGPQVKLAILFVDSQGHSMLPQITNGYAASFKFPHEVAYRADGKDCIIEGYDGCHMVRLTQVEDEPSGLRFELGNFIWGMFETVKDNYDYQPHAKVTLKCEEIFGDDKAHAIEWDAYRVKNSALLLPVKGTVTVDGKKAEYIDEDVYKIIL